MMLLRAFDATPFSVASFLVFFFLPLLPTTTMMLIYINPKPLTTMKREEFFQFALSILCSLSRSLSLSLSLSLPLFDVVVVVVFRARCGRGRRTTT